jgi:agmatine/peptidylarginine deiminase
MKDVVYFNEWFAHNHKDVFWAAKLNLEAYGVKVRTFNGTRNVWSRDYMPVQVGDHFVKFQYAKTPNDWDRWPQLKVAEECWRWVPNLLESPLILDGGNCVMGYGKAIVTEKFIHDNGAGSQEALEQALGCPVILIPVEPGDELGHSDGICRFVNHNTLIVNDYSCVFDKDDRFRKYQRDLEKTLEKANFNTFRFTYAFDSWDWDMPEAAFRQIWPDADAYSPGWGYFCNWLQTENVILLPAFGLPKDARARQIVDNLFPNHAVVMIDCRYLSMMGGLCNCVSWSFREP